MNLLKKILFCQFEFKRKKKPIGKTIEGKDVFRCENTKSLYVWTDPTKKYVNIHDVILNSEKP